MNVSASGHPPRHTSVYPRARPRIVDLPSPAHAVSVAAHAEVTASALPLWHGAWVGWLACQAVLLMLVESTELGTDARMAVLTRALLLTGFVAAFRTPCFVTTAQRNLFTLCVLAAELGIAAGCGRLPSTTGWALWTAIGAALLLLATATTARE